MTPTNEQVEEFGKCPECGAPCIREGKRNELYIYRPSSHCKTSGLDEQEFYELMQTYRHAPLHDQDRVVAAYEAVKSYILATIKVATAYDNQPKDIKND